MSCPGILGGMHIERTLQLAATPNKGGTTTHHRFYQTHDISHPRRPWCPQLRRPGAVLDPLADGSSLYSPENSFGALQTIHNQQFQSCENTEQLRPAQRTENKTLGDLQYGRDCT